jgi:hypothetical protein
MLLPGEGGSGKTTLTAALTLAGLQPLSDDMVLVDVEAGRLRAFPRNLLVKGDSASWLASQLGSDASAYELGQGAYSVPRERLGDPVDESTLDWLVFPRFDPSARTELAPMGQLAALERLIPLTVQPRGVLFNLVDMVKGARAFALTYADRDEAAEVLTALTRESR